MKILFLCHRFPYPPDHGARIRAFHFIRHLSQRHSVTVATLAHSRQEVVEGQGLKEFCHEVIAEVVPSRDPLVEGFRGTDLIGAIIRSVFSISGIARTNRRIAQRRAVRCDHSVLRFYGTVRAPLAPGISDIRLRGY